MVWLNERGILTTKGQQIDLDLIVYSTGYDATGGVVSYPVVGKGGQTVQQAWAEYPRAYLGTSLPGFPNLFVVTGPNTGIGHASAIFVIEAQVAYILPGDCRRAKPPGPQHRGQISGRGRLNRHVPGFQLHLPHVGASLQAGASSVQLIRLIAFSLADPAQHAGRACRWASSQNSADWSRSARPCSKAWAYSRSSSVVMGASKPI